MLSYACIAVPQDSILRNRNVNFEVVNRSAGLLAGRRAE